MSILTGWRERALKAERELAAANKKILILRRAMSEGSLQKQRDIEELRAQLNNAQEALDSWRDNYGG